MRNSPPSAAGRILTLLSTVILVALSFIVVFSGSKHHDTRSIFLYKRDQSSGTTTTTPLIQRVSPTQGIPTASPSHISPSDSQPLIPSPKPTPTHITTPASDNPTPTPRTSDQTSDQTSSDTPTLSESSTSTLAVDTTTTSQVSSDSATVSPSVVTSTSSIQSSDTPSVTYEAPPSPTTAIPRVTNQATVMQTGTAPPLPTTTISSSAPVNSATSSGFLANKGAFTATFTVVTLIAIVLLFMGYNFIARRRRHVRYRREDEEAYLEKSTQQPAEPGDSGLDEAEVASMTNAMSPASADAYPDRQVHYGSQGPEVTYTPQDYGIDYPPGTNYHQAEFEYGASTDNDTQHRQSSPGSLAPVANRDRAEHDPFDNTTVPHAV